MSKIYVQKPAEKPGGMILLELNEEEIKSNDLMKKKEQDHTTGSNRSRVQNMC